VTRAHPPALTCYKPATRTRPDKPVKSGCVTRDTRTRYQLDPDDQTQMQILPNRSIVDMITSHSTLKELTYYKILTIKYQPQFTQHEIIEEPPSHVPTLPSSVAETPTETLNPSVPPLPLEAKSTGRRKMPLVPTYDAPWWYFF
jgi:hypothetical protein